MQHYHWQTSVGAMNATVHQDQIVQLSFGEGDTSSIEKTLLHEELEAQMNSYLQGQLKTFDLPLAPQGTAFQQAVWRALQEIPFGQTWSYRQLAEFVQRPKGYQAVGQANGKNPIAIIIPCHRVINANGELGGYAGGLDNKRKLLKLEGLI